MPIDNIIKKLLITPHSFPDESPGSIIIRAAELNGFKHPRELITAYQLFSRAQNLSTRAILKDKKKWGLISNFLNLPSNYKLTKGYTPLGLTRRSHIHFMGLSVHAKYLRHNYASICPECIKEQGFAKQIWDLSFIHSCSDHKIALINQCEKCFNPIKWNRSSLNACGCEFPFHQSQYKASSCKETEKLSQKILNSEQSQLDEFCEIYDALVLMPKSLSPIISEKSRVRLAIKLSEDDFEIVKFLLSKIQSITAKEYTHPRVILGNMLASKNQRIKLAVAKILNEAKTQESKAQTQLCNTDFVGIAKARAILAVSSQQVNILLNKDIIYGDAKRKVVYLDSINTLLLSAIQSPSNKELQPISYFKHSKIKSLKQADVLEQSLFANTLYLPKNMNAGIYEYQTSKTVEQSQKDHDYLSIQELAEKCKCNYENIRFLIHNEFIERVPASQTKGTKILIPYHEAMSFSKDYVFAGTLARKHSANPTNFAEKLIACGINPISGPAIDGGLTFLFRQKDITPSKLKVALCTKDYDTRAGRKKGDPKSNFNKSSLSLTDAATKLNISIQAVHSLIKNNVLTKEKSKKREVLITSSGLNKLLAIINDKNLYCLKSSAEIVKETKRQFQKRWISTGYIKTVDSGLGHYVKEADLKRIMDLKSKHISSTDFAKEHGASKAHLINLEKRSLIKPSHVFTSGDTSIKFYSKKEVFAVIDNL